MSEMLRCIPLALEPGERGERPTASALSRTPENPATSAPSGEFRPPPLSDTHDTGAEFRDA